MGVMVTVGAWGREVVAEVEEEAKLIAMPRGGEELLFEIRRFEEERGCVLTEIRVGRSGFLKLCQMARMLGRPAVMVQLEEEVREGHVVMVGGAAASGSRDGGATGPVAGGWALI